MKIYKVKVNGKTYKVELESIEENKDSMPVKKEETPKEDKAVVSSGEGNQVLSPIQGVISNIKTTVGQKVKKGDVILLVEAMKLENEVVSTFDGTVSEILVTKGQNVSAKQPLVVIK